jgi:hypothetical protein
VKEMLEEIEKQIKFDPFSGCYWCGVPHEICNRWEDNRQGGYQRVAGENCQYNGVLIAGVIGIAFGNDEIMGRWTRRIEEMIEEQGITLVAYLGKKQALERTESNNVTREFCWITRMLAE